MNLGTFAQFGPLLTLLGAWLLVTFILVPVVLNVMGIRLDKKDYKDGLLMWYRVRKAISLIFGICTLVAVGLMAFQNEVPNSDTEDGRDLVRDQVQRTEGQ